MGTINYTDIQPKLNPNAGSQNRSAWSATVYGFGNHAATSPSADRTRYTAKPTTVNEMVIAAGYEKSTLPSKDITSSLTPLLGQGQHIKSKIRAISLTWTMSSPLRPSTLFRSQTQ